MDRHLIAVKVGVERGTVQGMEFQGASIHKDRFKSLNAQTVQRGGAVQHDGVILNDNVQRVPHFRDALVYHLFGGLNIVRGAVLHQFFHDKRAEQFHGHFLGHAALIDFQFRTDDNDAPPGVVHALAQQVLAETPLLALEHIAEGF